MTENKAHPASPAPEDAQIAKEDSPAPMAAESDAVAKAQAADDEKTTIETAPRVELEVASVADPSPKPIGFLGRRGTASIRLGSEEKDPSTEGEEASSAQKEREEQPATSHQSSPPPPLKAGMAENAFRAMSFLAMFFLALLLGLQTATGVWFPSVYLPGELALTEVYAQMSSVGQWLVPPATAALPAALPGYFWFMGLVNLLPVNSAFFLPLTAALSALTMLLGVYVLGLCAKLGNRVSFAAGLILLSSLAFVPLTHYVGPDMLMGGLLALSLGCLYRGWTCDSALGWLATGFVLAAMAVLVGGLVALWIPLLGSVAFIIWRGTLRRAHKLDAVLGFGLLLLCIAGWLGAVILLGGDHAANLGPLRQQLLSPFMPPLWPPRDAWWLGLALLPLCLMPWALVPLFVSWGRVAGSSWSSLKASRKENSGTAWLWICLVTGILFMLVVSSKPCLMALPLLPMAALLLAKALLNLSPTGSRLFYLLLAVCCLLLGVLFTVAGIPAAAPLWSKYVPQQVSAVVQPLQGLPILGAVCLLASVALLKLTNRAFPGGSLAVVVLFTIMLVQPATLLTAPSLVGTVAKQHPLGMGIGILPVGKAVTPEAPKAKPMEKIEETAPAKAAPTDPTLQPPAQEEQHPAVPAAAEKSAPQEEKTPVQEVAPATAPPPAPAPAALEEKQPENAAPAVEKPVTTEEKQLPLTPAPIENPQSVEEKALPDSPEKKKQDPTSL